MRDNNLKLNIENISLNDRGRYECQAENLAGRSQQMFDVQVYGKSNIAKDFKINQYLFFSPTGNSSIEYQSKSICYTRKEYYFIMSWLWCSGNKLSVVKR
jgi:hypothetical protein